MTVEEYQSAVQAVILTARILKQHDVPQLLEDIERADAFGPFLDPTLWRDKHKAMLEDKEMLQAALPLWRLAERLEKMSDDK